MKICYKCKQEKPLKEFRRYKSGANKGHCHSYCKVCEYKYKKIYPWVKTYIRICSRTRDKANKNYKRYKNIKMLMTLGDLKYLWFRDKAYLMEKPSIDRKNSKGHYTLKNCRYIEWLKNCSEGGKSRRRK